MGMGNVVKKEKEKVERPNQKTDGAGWVAVLCKQPRLEKKEFRI